MHFLIGRRHHPDVAGSQREIDRAGLVHALELGLGVVMPLVQCLDRTVVVDRVIADAWMRLAQLLVVFLELDLGAAAFTTRIELFAAVLGIDIRSEEHTSELQSLMRNSYADFCLIQTQSDIQYAVTL